MKGQATLQRHAATHLALGPANLASCPSGSPTSPFKGSCDTHNVLLWARCQLLPTSLLPHLHCNTATSSHRPLISSPRAPASERREERKD